MTRDHLEAKLHTSIVLEFTNHRRHLYSGQLFPGLSELLATRIGGTLRSLGLIKDLPDLFYAHNGNLYGLEVKAPTTSHNRLHLISQADMMIKHCRKGWFVDSLDEVFAILHGIECGDTSGRKHEAEVIKKRCEEMTGKTVQWDAITLCLLSTQSQKSQQTN